MLAQQVQDFAFVITDGSIQSIFTQFGFESYEEAKKVLSRKLASNWSIVEDVNTIQSFIKNEVAVVEDLKQLEQFNQLADKFYLNGLDLLIKQHVCCEITCEKPVMENSMVGCCEEHEEILKEILDEEHNRHIEELYSEWFSDTMASINESLRSRGMNNEYLCRG